MASDWNGIPGFRRGRSEDGRESNPWRSSSVSLQAYFSWLLSLVEYFAITGNISNPFFFYKERIASFLKPSVAPRSKFSVGLTNDRFLAKLIRRVGCHVSRNTSTVKQKFDCTKSILPISVKDETPLLVAKQSFNLDLRNICYISTLEN